LAEGQPVPILDLSEDVTLGQRRPTIRATTLLTGLTEYQDLPPEERLQLCKEGNFDAAPRYSITWDSLETVVKDARQEADEFFGNIQTLQVTGKALDDKEVTVTITEEDDDTKHTDCEKLVITGAYGVRVYRYVLRKAVRSSEAALRDRDLLCDAAQLLQNEVSRLTALGNTVADPPQAELEELTTARTMIEELTTEMGRLRLQLTDQAQELEQLRREARTVTPGMGWESKSSKLPDPEPLTNGNGPTIRDWERNVMMKLRANADHFPSEEAKLAYCLTRIRDPALSIIKYRLDDYVEDRIENVTALMAALHDAFADPTEIPRAEQELDLMRMGPRDNFGEFRLKFEGLARKADLHPRKWKQKFFEKLPHELRLSAVREQTDDTVTFSRFCMIASQQAYQISKTLKDKDRQERFRRDKGSGRRETNDNYRPTGSTGGGNGGRPRPEATGEGRGGRPTRLTDEERRRLVTEGRCFKCREVGHVSTQCPTRGGRQATLIKTEVVAVVPNTADASVSGSDSEN
jgi:hypothetical protein